MQEKRDPRMSKREVTTWESIMGHSQHVNIHDLKSTLVKGISTIADTYDQYCHTNNNTCERSIPNQKTLGSMAKRQSTHSVK